MIKKKILLKRPSTIVAPTKAPKEIVELPPTNEIPVPPTPVEERMILVSEDIYDVNPLERIERVFNLQRKISAEKVQAVFSHYQTMGLEQINEITTRPNFEKHLSVLETDVLDLISISKDVGKPNKDGVIVGGVELKDRMDAMKYRHDRAWGKTIEKREISGIDGDSVKIDVFDAQKSVENLSEAEVRKLIAIMSK